jgi:hypothetical protein
MPNEVYDSYEWATDAFEELIFSQSNYGPEVILTDNEDAVKAAAEHTWPSIPQLLCVWHVNQNVLTHAQKVWAVRGSLEEKLANGKLREAFMKKWRNVIYAKTPEKFDENWDTLMTEYGAIGPHHISPDIAIPSALRIRGSVDI